MRVEVIYAICLCGGSDGLYRDICAQVYDNRIGVLLKYENLRSLRL